LLQDIQVGPLGSADKLTMMYAFRWVLTQNDPIRIEKPDEYDPRTYEIFRRGFQKGVNMWAGRKMHVLGEYFDLEGEAHPEDSVGLGSYGVDDWSYATIAHEGGVALSGGEFSILKANPLHNGIHSIPYRAITPKKNECENLLVPVCCSASHIAMTSIRMEPVWITLGLSAGIAAAHVVAEKSDVQTIDFARYRRALLDAGQILK